VIIIPGYVTGLLLQIQYSRFEQKATMSERIREFIGGFQAGIAEGLLVVLIILAVGYQNTNYLWK